VLVVGSDGVAADGRAAERECGADDGCPVAERFEGSVEPV
jgi:hypothetical protein